MDQQRIAGVIGIYAAVFRSLGRLLHRLTNTSTSDMSFAALMMTVIHIETCIFAFRHRTLLFCLFIRPIGYPLSERSEWRRYCCLRMGVCLFVSSRVINPTSLDVKF